MNRNGDGRYIDERVGRLSGEASGQEVSMPDVRPPGAPQEAWSVPASGDGETTYFDRPVVKEPVWIWSVPLYFFVGGSAGAAATLSAVSALLRRKRLRRLRTRARWVAATGTATGGVLLTYDLGRPERFFNMLRVFRITSPMSVGSWVLAATSGAAGAAAVLDRAEGAAGRAGNAAEAAAGILGLPMSSYTAVLFSDTAIPIWQATRRTMPHLFAGSAISGAASILELFDLTSDEERVLHRFGVAGKTLELGAALAFDREASEVERVGRPLREGVSGALWRGAKALTAASLALSVAPGRSPAKRRVAAAAGIAGGIAIRFAVFQAGRASARDPRATFHQQRAGRGAAEVTGRKAVSGPAI